MTATPIYAQVSRSWPARDRDPSTSHAAVPSASKVAMVQARVLAIIDAHGPLTHEEIHDYYVIRHGYVTKENVRTRTSELHQTWRVVALDREGRTSTGRTAVRWAARREENTNG